MNCRQHMSTLSISMLVLTLLSTIMGIYVIVTEETGCTVVKTEEIALSSESHMGPCSELNQTYDVLCNVCFSSSCLAFVYYGENCVNGCFAGCAPPKARSVILDALILTLIFLSW